MEGYQTCNTNMADVFQEHVRYILRSFNTGLRSFDQTVQNLKSYFRQQDESRRAFFLECLYTELFREISKKWQSLRRIVHPFDGIAREKAYEMSSKGLPEPFYYRVKTTRSSVRLLIAACIGCDSTDQFLGRLAGKEWGDSSTDERVAELFDALSAVLAADQLADDELQRIIAKCIELEGSGKSSRNLIACASQFRKHIENLAFTRFERTLQQTTLEMEQEVKTLEMTQRAVGSTAEIPRAIREAREYLQSEGSLDPFHAATLLRTAIDETHQWAVERIERITRRHPANDKDGARREFLRQEGFITETEEKFFSAIYSLISKAGVHRFSAPRETLLVMERAVTGYLLLLHRRAAARQSL
jgi:hypothetical protein